MSGVWHTNGVAAGSEVTIVGWDALCGQCGAFDSSLPDDTPEQIEARQERWCTDHLTGRCGEQR